MSFRLGVALLMFGAHIIEKQFLAMWKIEDLEWREYLALISSVDTYGTMNLRVMECWNIQWVVWGLYALKYYYRLEIEYSNYYHHHQIAKCGCLTFVIMPISETLDDVAS